MRAHIRFMGTTYLSLYLALFLLRMATDGVLDNRFFTDAGDALWGGGVALVAALFLGPKDERREGGV